MHIIRHQNVVTLTLCNEFRASPWPLVLPVDFSLSITIPQVQLG